MRPRMKSPISRTPRMHRGCAKLGNPNPMAPLAAECARLCFNAVDGCPQDQEGHAVSYGRLMLTPGLNALPTQLKASDTKVYEPLGTVVVFQLSQPSIDGGSGCV